MENKIDFGNTSSEDEKSENNSIEPGLFNLDSLLSINSLDKLAAYLGVDETLEMGTLRFKAIENLKSNGLGGDAYKEYQNLGRQVMSNKADFNDPEQFIIYNIALALRQALIYYEAGCIDYFQEDIEEILIFEQRVIERDEKMNQFYKGLSKHIRKIVKDM